jgi:uncharacterized protein with PIN domain
MLGKLTRWLRMLGHDVEYYQATDDKKLVWLAESQKRILLTSDKKLHQQMLKKGLDAVLVNVSDDAQRLAILAKRYGFKLIVDLSISRCPKCNSTLAKVTKHKVLDKIPKMTSTYYDNFWECTSCSQVYWQGAHWKRIQTTLTEATNKLNLL